MTRKQYRITRRLMVFMAAMPLLQFTECKTVTSQTLQLIANQMPSTIFSLVQSVALAPLFSLLGGGSGTGNFGGGGFGNNNSGFGGGGI